jgi:hypothetical protein
MSWPLGFLRHDAVPRRSGPYDCLALGAVSGCLVPSDSSTAPEALAAGEAGMKRPRSVDAMALLGLTGTGRFPQLNQPP